MIIRKTERYYKESSKTWFKRGRYDKAKHFQTVKRVTWWLLFIPIFWNETIISYNI